MVYADLLLRWNRKVNLSAIDDPTEVLRRHFGESMFAAGVVRMDSGRLVDVGSGAGFPGLAIKLLCPGLSVKLLEPNLKKAAFLSEVVRELELAEVQVVREPFDSPRCPVESGSVDFLTARALGRWDSFLKWARGALASEGRVILWLGTRHAETMRTTKGWEWRELIPIPESERRFLVIGKKAAK